MSRPSVVPWGVASRAIASLVLLTAACGGALPKPEVRGPEGRQFVPMVPDSIDDVGLAPSVTVDGEGLPNISYFGFPAVLEDGASVRAALAEVEAVAIRAAMETPSRLDVPVAVV